MDGNVAMAEAEAALAQKVGEEEAAVAAAAAATAAAVVEAGLAAAKEMAAGEEVAPNFRLKRPPPLEVSATPLVCTQYTTIKR